MSPFVASHNAAARALTAEAAAAGCGDPENWGGLMADLFAVPSFEAEYDELAAFFAKLDTLRTEVVCAASFTADRIALAAEQFGLTLDVPTVRDLWTAIYTEGATQ